MGVYEKLTVLGDRAVKKLSNLAEIARLNALNLKETSVQNGLFDKLGRRYFNLYGENPSEELLQITEDIKESLFKTSVYKEKLQFLRNRRVCPACGQRVSRDAVYCQRCGVMLPAPPLAIGSVAEAPIKAVEAPKESISEESISEESILQESILQESISKEIVEDLIKSD
jgi:hypothetical protein